MKPSIKLRSNPSRSGFVAAGAAGFATIGILPALAKAAQFEFKCATTFPNDHPATIRMRQMWTAVQNESGGRIRTEFFPGGVLGGDSALVDQVRIGAIQFYHAGLGTLGSIVPLANIFFLGFAFNDAREGLGLVDGPLGDFVRREVEAQSLHPLRTVWASGLLEVSSSLRPVRVPDDLKGFKLRVAPGRMAGDLFKTFGANPLSINNNEIYTALQTKLIDGQAAPLALIESGRLYETQKYISLTNHQIGRAHV
jgi:TRAP-type transport system periplasmic protein